MIWLMKQVTFCETNKDMKDKKLILANTAARLIKKEKLIILNLTILGQITV